MQQLIKTLTIFISLLFLITGLTSCGNLLTADLKPQAQSSGTKQSHNAIGSINGSFTVEGAVPSQFFNTGTQTGRTAFPGLQYTSQEAEFVVEAIPDNNELEYVSGTVDGTDFSITGLELGESYTINARWEATSDGRVLLQGNASEKVTLTEDNPGAEVGTIILLPSQEADGKGDIYLVIDASQVTNHTLTTLKVSFEKKAEETFTDPDPYSFTESVDGSIAIDIENVPSGARKMYIEVYATIADYGQDVLVYKCTETVNVFDNLLTDYWVKNGKEAYLNGDNFYADFQLTNSIIEKFQKTSFYVDTSTGVNAGSGSYFSPFNSVQTALTEMVYYEPELEKTLYIRGNGKGEQITNAFYTDANLNLSIEVYKAETTDPGTFRIKTGGNYAFYVNEGSTLNVKGLTFDGTGFVNGGDGGFFYVNGGTANFTDCTFSNGSSCAGGGAIANNRGTVTLSDCYFEGNNSYVGNANAIYGYNGSVTKIAGSTWFSPNDPILLDGTGKLEIDPTLSLPDAAAGKCAVIELDDYTRTEPFITVTSGTSGTSGTVDAVKGYFLLENYAITSQGLATAQTISMSARTADGDPMFLSEIKSWEDAFKEAFSKHYPSYTITIPDGSYFTWPDYYNDNDNDIFYNYHYIDSNDISITSSGRATIKIEKPVDCNNNYSFYAYGIDFIGSGESSNNSGGLFFLNSQNEENPHDASFRNCSFSNGKSNDEGGAIYNQATLTLENCTFSNNFMYGDTANDVVSWGGELKLLETNSFSSPICINKSSSSTPAIYLNGGTVLSEGKTTYASISCIDWLSESRWITTGDKIIKFTDNGEVKELDGRENWFPVVDEGGYAIGSDGCLKAVNTLYVGSTGTTLKNAVSQCNTEKDNIIWVESGYSETLANQLEMTGIKADIRVTDSLSSPSISANGTCTLNLSGNRAHLIIQSSSTITFTGINFAREAGDSLSGEGGIIYNVGSSNVTCTRCSFTNGSSAVNTSNNSGGPGGAIFNNATLTLNSCTFTNCSSAKEGGAIYNSGELILSDCTFSGNTASSVSNDIYHTGTSVTLKAGNIFDGGIKLDTGKMLTIAEALDVGDGTIKITLPSYTVGTQILDGDGVEPTISNNIIELADSNYIIDSEGKLQVNSTEPVVSITYYASEANPLSSLYSNYKGNTQKLIITIPENGTLASQGYTLSTIPTVTIQPADNHSATITFAGGAKTFYIGNNGMTNFNFNNITFERTDDSSGEFVYSYSGLTVTYKGCTFMNGKSDEGVISVGADSEHIFENCNFTSNSPRAITIAAYGTLTLKGANSFGENDTIEILRNYQKKIRLEAESVVKSGSTVKIYTQSFPDIKDKQIFEGTYVSQAADFECTDPNYYFDSDGYCRER